MTPGLPDFGVVLSNFSLQVECPRKTSPSLGRAASSVLIHSGMSLLKLPGLSSDSQPASEAIAQYGTILGGGTQRRGPQSSIRSCLDIVNRPNRLGE